MKKLLFIGLVVAGFAFASAPRSDAGVSIGIGLGIPGGYYGPYPYGYGCYRPYRAYYRYPRPYYRTVVYSSPRRYWHRGHRVYYSRPHHYRRY